MAKYTKQLHFLRNGEIRDVQLYTSLSDVVDANVINADGTTGGITLYTSTDDVDYPYLRLMEGNTPVYAALEELTASNTTETGLKVSANGRSYVVVNSIKKPIGVCYFQQDGAWVWRRVDENGKPLSSSPNFNNIFPWKGVESVEIDGQAMVKIPKFYVKADTIASGTYAGAKARWVSAEKLDGYHIHPAFVKNGYVMDCIYIGAYEASIVDGKSSSIADVMPTACPLTASPSWGDRTRWRYQTLYDIAAINYLLLIELGTPDAQVAIGYGNQGSVMNTGSTNAVYRGIHEWWGNTNTFISGMGCQGGVTPSFKLYSNQGDGTSVAGVSYGGGYIATLDDTHVTTLDRSDLFLPGSQVSDAGSSLIPDIVIMTFNSSWYSNPIKDYFAVMHNNKGSDSDGPFAMSLQQVSSNSNFGITCYARIAKDGELTSEAAPYR